MPTVPPELEAALDDSAATLRAATESLYAGQSTLEEWAAGMADGVRLAHAAAAVAALGDDAHADYVKSLVAPHVGHLENFLEDLASADPPTATQAADRAASFARLAAGTYLEALRGVASFAGGATSAPEPFPPGDGLADPRRRVRDDGWEEVYDPASGTWVAGDQLDSDDLDDPDASFAFDPDQPRGQPGNRGQFGPGGGDAGAAVAAKTNARAAELTAGRRQKGRERRAAVRARREAELTATLAQPPRVAGPAAQAIGPALARLFPEGFAAEDAHALVGAPKGSVVGGYANEYTGGVNLTLDHPHVDQCSRSLSRNKAGELVMSNQMFFLKKANRGSGLGLQVFSGEVRTLAALGVDRIETCAGKGGIMNGYYTWAVLGYDAPLDRSQKGFGPGMEARFKRQIAEPFTRRDGRVRAALTPEGADAAWEKVKDAATVQGVMATPEGREYWLRNGYMGGMTFDLKPGSRSLSVLNDYLKSKGKAPVEVDAAKVEALKARREEARKAGDGRRGREAKEAEGKKQRQAMNEARAYWRGQAAEAGISGDVLDSKAGTVERRMIAERHDSPDRVFSTDDPAMIRHDAYRTAATDLVAARHAERMADPSLADVRDHYEREAEARGLDPARVRAAAAELAYPSPDGVYAVGRAYADAIKSLAGDKAGVASFALNPGQSRGQPGNAGEFGPGGGDDADARLEYSRRRDAAGAAVRAGKLAAARRAEYEVENRIHGKQVVVFDRPAGGAYDDPHRRAVEGAVLALVRERHPSDGEPTPIYRPAERHGQATEFVGGRPGSGGGVRSRGFVVGAGDGVTVGTADGRRLIGVRPSDPPDYVRFKIHVGLGLKPPPALTERWAPVLREERATHKSASGVSFARESRPASPRVAAAVRRFWERAAASFARNTGPDLSGLEDDLLGLSRPELLEVLAEAAGLSLEEDDASFSFRDQPRVPAGQPGGGRWAGGISPGTAAARDAASDAVREFARGRGPHTAADAGALAGHLSRLTVAQIHTLKKEHGLKGSAPNKAALVAKLAERFRAHRERNPVAAKEPVPDWPEGYDIFEKRDVFADEPVDAGTLEPAAPSAPAAKEPWQQTRKAFVGSGAGRHTRGLVHGDAIKQAILAGKEVPGRVLRDYPGFAERVLAEREAAKNPPPDPAQAERDRLAEWSRKAVADPTSVRAHDFAHYASDPAADKAWEYRQDGTSRSQHYAEIHRKAVEAAVLAGKAVPPEVLADYPDLAAKAAPPPTPAPSPPRPAPSLSEMTDRLLAALPTDRRTTLDEVVRLLPELNPAAVAEVINRLVRRGHVRKEKSVSRQGAVSNEPDPRFRIGLGGSALRGVLRQVLSEMGLRG